MSDTPLVRLIHLGKRFTKGKDTITIFEDLEFSIAAGDFVAVMGPSGSGKTIVLVTHDPAAARYARRTLHLDKGRFIEEDLAA